MESKGFIVGAFTAFVIGAGIAIVSVLIFFLVFKVRIDLQLREEYVWNKVQEVPLDLFSMEVDGELFVHKMNKIYYFGTDTEKTQFREIIDGIISKQLFYFFEGTQYPLTFEIRIDGIRITKYMAGCNVRKGLCTMGICDFYCNDDCGPNSGKYVGSTFSYKGYIFLDQCLYTTGTRIQYSANYPFPLTFNGTDKFVDELSYEAIEER